MIFKINEVANCRSAICEELCVGNLAKSDSIELTLRLCYSGCFQATCLAIFLLPKSVFKKFLRKTKKIKVTATFRSKEIINVPNFYYYHHHHSYQKVETQFVLGYFSIRFAFCTHRSSSVKGDKRDRQKDKRVTQNT